MSEQFWHNLITEKSFTFLQNLARRFTLVVIGGWAVYLYTGALKSKDVDIIVNFEELGRLKKSFDLIKNERLRKYEIRGDGFDVDIYVPHWSELGLPLDFVIKNSVSREGFHLPRKEVLLALKIFVYRERKSSLKGKKDALDIISLLHEGDVDIKKWHGILQEHKLAELAGELSELLKTVYEARELNLNKKRFADFKHPILKKLKELPQ